MTTLRNLAHDTIAVIGVLLAVQAPITAQLVAANAPQKWIDYAFGAIGLLASLLSKYVDSKSYTAITVAKPTA